MAHILLQTVYDKILQLYTLAFSCRLRQPVSDKATYSDIRTYKKKNYSIIKIFLFVNGIF